MQRSFAPSDVAVYDMLIQAVDGGGLTATVPATVHVTFSNDDPQSPLFTQLLYTAKVREDTLPGIAIGQVVAKGVPILV